MQIAFKQKTHLMNKKLEKFENKGPHGKSWFSQNVKSYFHNETCQTEEIKINFLGLLIKQIKK